MSLVGRAIGLSIPIVITQRQSIASIRRSKAGPHALSEAYSSYSIVGLMPDGVCDNSTISNVIYSADIAQSGGERLTDYLNSTEVL